MSILLPVETLLELDLSHSDWLVDIPFQVLSCLSLTRLNISGCPLRDGVIPGDLSCFRELLILEANDCTVSRIDERISTLPRLQHFSLQDNYFQEIPPHLVRLAASLRILDLRGNPYVDPQYSPSFAVPIPYDCSSTSLNSKQSRFGLRKMKSTNTLKDVQMIEPSTSVPKWYKVSAVDVANASAWPVGPLPVAMEESRASTRTSSTSGISTTTVATSVYERELDLEETTRTMMSKLRDIYEINQGKVLSDPVSEIRPPEKQEDPPFQEDAVRAKRIIQEIIETEQTYVQQLEELAEIYIEPVNLPFYPLPSERKIVFSHILTLLRFHRNYFFPALEWAYSNTHITVAINKAFEEHVVFMKMYASYVDNFDSAMEIVIKWNTTCHKYLKMKIKHEKHSQIDLSAYLLLPIQRIPRYRLLLADLSRCSKSAVNSYQLISSLANEMNDRKRDSEGRKRFIEIQEMLGTNTIILPARRYIREGWLLFRRKTEISGRGAEENVGKWIFTVLCSDILLLCTSKQPYNPNNSRSGNMTLQIFHVFDITKISGTSDWYADDRFRIVCWDKSEVWHFEGKNAPEWVKGVNQR
ncbi:FYVE, RhoGEF and PH domain-containing protein 4 [Neolecta irregularis DAH-3]|uniref:FYVE, RhoGEF and PH domain-containing protein 4 n=1 Tax=Neolecta irregularis (strain DAH-3) TaxID=1198029 RepID=A0A1U7LVC6_NEOID|nr:FYVE, RhoGEF and PH domain-containing protein 4 [Neolecta irregularis DAH-3]|eukprot:OLL26579.1 FYVE, RhoGEF and PH domain-containing protein 4 [Neolecta irregularis DAH-3]